MIARLVFANATPLVAGATYQAQVTGGKDSGGLKPAPVNCEFPRAERSDRGGTHQTSAVAGRGDLARWTTFRQLGGWQPNTHRSLLRLPGRGRSGCGVADDRRPHELEAARRYLNWHATRFNPDGTIYDFTGSYPTYTSTGDYDSSDSYGALFAVALWHYYAATGDSSYVAGKWDAVTSAVAAMNLTLEPDNLTWAKPTYLMKYTMDNCEVYQGYFAAARLAQLLDHTAQYQLWIARSDAVRSAILGDLWMGSDSPPRYAVFKGQGASQYWDDYYPGGMANDFPLIYAHLPFDARVQTAWSATRAKFLPGHVPASGVGIFAAWAAHGRAMARLSAPPLPRPPPSYGRTSTPAIRGLRCSSRRSDGPSRWSCRA